MPILTRIFAGAAVAAMVLTISPSVLAQAPSLDELCEARPTGPDAVIAVANDMQDLVLPPGMEVEFRELLKAISGVKNIDQGYSMLRRLATFIKPHAENEDVLAPFLARVLNQFKTKALSLEASNTDINVQLLRAGLVEKTFGLWLALRPNRLEPYSGYKEAQLSALELTVKAKPHLLEQVYETANSHFEDVKMRACGDESLNVCRMKMNAIANSSVTARLFQRYDKAIQSLWLKESDRRTKAEIDRIMGRPAGQSTPTNSAGGYSRID